MNEEYLKFAKETAHEAGRIMLKYFEKDHGVTYKLDQTIVTLVDKEINQYLIDQVKKNYPYHSVDGEEDSFGESNYVWVCDPLDGTAMYARNIPVSVFSLALVIDGVPEVGVVYDPFTENLYSAIKGQGAYKNNTKIHVNDISLDDMKSVSHFDMWPQSPYNIYKVITELGKKTYFISIGSIIRASMAVASGQFNLAMYPGITRKNCDIAAAKVIVEEAGGKVTNFFGKDQRYDRDIDGAVISNGKVHDEVIKAIKKYCDKN